MKKNITFIAIAFSVLLFILAVVCIILPKSADITAVYTRYNLSWENADLSDDGSVALDLQGGKAMLRLRNDVTGKIGYNIYLYKEKGASGDASLSAKGTTEIAKSEYPAFLDSYDVKSAYSGYLDGGKIRYFKIESDTDSELRLFMVMEDNNSYPKEEKPLPTIANVKFSAEVLLDGQYPRGSKYSFSLKDEQGESIETVQNDDGYVSFSGIALKEKGTFIYYISQNEGKDKKTSYDQSVYKITVVAEGKNAVTVSYEKDGKPIETLPRFSNYKEYGDIIDTETIAEYPSNEKQSDKKPNFLVILTLSIASLLVLFYIISGRKKG